jgi:hypothetical protein
VLAQLAEKEESFRHLTAEEFKAYADGRLTGASLNDCQAHLDSCEDCRAELEDLRTVKTDLASFPRPEPNKGVLARNRRRTPTMPMAAAIAIIGIAGVSTVLWWKHESPAGNTSAALAQAPAVAQAPAAAQPAPAAAATGNATRTAAIVQASAAAHAPAAARPAANSAPSPAATAPTRSAAIARAPAAAAAAAPPATRVFALLSPLGATVSDPRPEFTWQALPGAQHYSVAIVDARLHPVQHSHALHTTSWRPPRPLHRGRTYLWQVTATLRGGSKVVAASPATITETK